MRVNLDNVYRGIVKSNYRKVKIGPYSNILIDDSIEQQSDVKMVSKCTVGSLLKALIKITKGNFNAHIYGLVSRHYKKIHITNYYVPDWINCDEWQLINYDDLGEIVKDAKIRLVAFDIYTVYINVHKA